MITCYHYTKQQPPQHGGAVFDSVWVGSNGCWPFQGSQLPRTLPSHKPFFRRDALKDRKRAARSHFEIS